MVVGHHLHHKRVGDDHEWHEGENDKSELPRIIKGDCKTTSKSADIHYSFADFPASRALNFSSVGSKSSGQVAGRVQGVVEIAHVESEKLGEGFFAKTSREKFSWEAEHPAHDDESDEESATEDDEHEWPEKDGRSVGGL